MPSMRLIIGRQCVTDSHTSKENRDGSSHIWGGEVLVALYCTLVMYLG